jgi:hypothetical protein
MNAGEVPFLEAVKQEWQAIARALPASVSTLDCRLSPEHGKLCIEVEWPGHVASITAWQHATCLDVDVLDVTSKEGRILVWGPCEVDGEASARLRRFRDYIQSSLGRG